MLTDYADLELQIVPHEDDSYRIALRFRMPRSDADPDLLDGQPAHATIDPTTLINQLDDDEAYGHLLGAMLLADQNLAAAVSRARDMARAQDHGLRWRLITDNGADALHRLHWEKLILPGDSTPLSCSERTIFSRYLSSPDTASVTVPRLSTLRAIALAASPSDLEGHGMATIDAGAELARAKASLAPIPATALGHGQASLKRLLNPGSHDTGVARDSHA